MDELMEYFTKYFSYLRDTKMNNVSVDYDLAYLELIEAMNKYFAYCDSQGIACVVVEDVAEFYGMYHLLLPGHIPGYRQSFSGDKFLASHVESAKLIFKTLVKQFKFG